MVHQTKSMHTSRYPARRDISRYPGEISGDTQERSNMQHSCNQQAQKGAGASASDACM